MNTSILHGRKIFLVDAIGAFISALSLLIPFFFEDIFGMPQNVVSTFICIAIGCFLYSTTIHLSQIENWKPYLTIIALVNIGYCLFTVYHIFKNVDTMTLIGHVYFVGEILIILTLSVFELRLGRA